MRRALGASLSFCLPAGTLAGSAARTGVPGHDERRGAASPLGGALNLTGARECLTMRLEAWSQGDRHMDQQYQHEAQRVSAPQPAPRPKGTRLSGCLIALAVVGVLGIVVVLGVVLLIFILGYLSFLTSNTSTRVFCTRYVTIPVFLSCFQL